MDNDAGGITPKDMDVVTSAYRGRMMTQLRSSESPSADFCISSACALSWWQGMGRRNAKHGVVHALATGTNTPPEDAPRASG